MPRIQFKTSGGFDPALTLVITGTGKAPTALTGTWEATLGGGPDWTLQLETDGGVVHGRILSGTLGEQFIPIYDGSIEGETLRFKLKSPDGARTISFTGTLQGNALTFTRGVEVAAGGRPGAQGLLGVAGPRAFTAKRLQ
jgi:hypothetical protein